MWFGLNFGFDYALLSIFRRFQLSIRCQLPKEGKNEEGTRKEKIYRRNITDIERVVCLGNLNCNLMLIK